jgi:hypothetical protein
MAHWYPSVGTVSHATLRNEDLLEAFAGELESCLERVGKNEAHSKLVEEASSVDPDDEGACDVVQDLMDALEEYAPPFCYFGAHPGDGSDFGWWVSMEAVEAARRDGELPSGDELPECGSREEGQFLVVSDHGNATLYLAHSGGLAGFDSEGSRWREVWGIV